MRPLLHLITPIVAGALVATAASAQTCVGLPSFEGRPVHVNVAAEFPDSAKAYSAGLAVGGASGLFGAAGVGQVSLDAFDGKATFGFLEAGFQLPVGRAQVCPLLGGAHAVGPNDDLTGLEVRTTSLAGGVSAGLLLDAGPVSFIPNAAVRYQHDSQRVEEPGLAPGESTFDTTVVDLGIGLLLRNWISVQPLIHIPLIVEEGDVDDVTFGVFASVAIGFPR